METNTQSPSKLELTLCNLLPYKLMISCHDVTDIDYDDEWITEVVEVDLRHKAIVDIDGNDWNFNVKPILHSLSKLTEPILKNGGIPIVELAKMVKQEYNWAVLDSGVCGCEFYKLTYKDGSFYLKDSSYRQVANQIELF